MGWIMSSAWLERILSCIFRGLRRKNGVAVVDVTRKGRQCWDVRLAC